MPAGDGGRNARTGSLCLPKSQLSNKYTLRREKAGAVCRESSVRGKQTLIAPTAQLDRKMEA